MTHLDNNNLPPLRDVIAAFDLRAKKSLGQNFLLDSNITDKIVRGAGDLSSVTVFEIGPGPGGLTRSLLKSAAKKIIAVEFDERAVAALKGLKDMSAGRLEIVQGNALGMDLTTLARGPRAIAANLPYNIATPLLLGWLRQIRGDADAFRSMTLMFQKEVGDRIRAAPGSKIYGRLSVITQWLCDVKKNYDLPPSAFTPPPKVSSSVLHFVPRAFDKDAPSFEAVEALTAAAFGQRRKMIRSTLKEYAAAIEVLGLDPTLRAEDLGLDDFIALAKFKG
ncbi:MAG: 16S rRNA (adenine(1518)-N(6)/adenine(1519)-N(6))-dimethyltransferase RsmA [Alphaproteobacteria bacterium]